MSARDREPGCDDDEPMVALGDALAAVDAGRAEAASAAAAEVLRTARTPPQALDAERAVLGAMLLSAAAYDDAVGEGLAPEHFYRPQHAALFRVIEQLHATGSAVDAVTVVDTAHKSGVLAKIGGGAGVAALAALRPIEGHASAYARTIRDKAALRQLVEHATRIVEGAFAQRHADDLFDDAEQALFALSSSRKKSAKNDIADRRVITRQVADAIGSKAVRGLPTGFLDLDQGLLKRGLRPGTLTVVAGRPAMGKSVFGHQVARHLSDQGIPTAFFSLEMAPEEIIEREVAAEAALPQDTWAQHLGRGRLEAAFGVVDQRMMHLIHCPGARLGQLASQARRLVARDGVQLLVFDYLGLIGGSGDYRGQRVQEVGEVSRGLKALAGELMVPILCLAQLNRGVEGRVDKRPGLADLRDSGEIEQDCDNIAFLCRPEYYMKDNTPADKIGICEVLVEKQRNGPTGVCELLFEGALSRFRNLARGP